MYSLYLLLRLIYSNKQSTFNLFRQLVIIHREWRRRQAASGRKNICTITRYDFLKSHIKAKLIHRLYHYKSRITLMTWGKCQMSVWRGAAFKCCRRQKHSIRWYALPCSRKGNLPSVEIYVKSMRVHLLSACMGY